VTVAASSYQTLGTQLPTTDTKNPTVPTNAGPTTRWRMEIGSVGYAGTARDLITAATAVVLFGIEQAFSVSLDCNCDQRRTRTDNTEHRDTSGHNPNPWIHRHHLDAHA
jgi:hypothetical protein